MMPPQLWQAGRPTLGRNHQPLMHMGVRLRIPPGSFDILPPQVGHVSNFCSSPGVGFPGSLSPARLAEHASLRLCRSARRSCSFISTRTSSANMAKGPDNKRVKPEFGEIYELLHRGFVEEKLVVPQSLMHDVETSPVSPDNRERIVSFQKLLGPGAALSFRGGR